MKNILLSISFKTVLTKLILLIWSIFFFANCKSQQIIKEEKPSLVKTSFCLQNLPITINYKNYIENYTSIYKDTVLELESTLYDSTYYKSVLELKPSSRYLWLLRRNQTKIDSFLVHSISPTKSVDIIFDTILCELEIEKIKYNQENGETISSSTLESSLEKWFSTK